jgi:hypothetical protein
MEGLLLEAAAFNFNELDDKYQKNAREVLVFYDLMGRSWPIAVVAASRMWP